MATIRQKKAFKLVETGRNTGEIMVAAGYSPKTAKAPTKLTKSKGWEELMEKYLPDKLLTTKHKELLEVPVKVRHFKKGELESEIEQLDSFAVSKGLDMAYKLKGKYAAEKRELSGKDGQPLVIKFDESFGKRDDTTQRAETDSRE